MKITALVENQSNSEIIAKHGLCLYIETLKHKILFDVGPDHTLFENSKKLGIDLHEIDTVILSHGHIDHGGALESFLAINSAAKVYVQRKAFEKHYSKFLSLKINIGISPHLKKHPQIILTEGDVAIDEELMLFTVKSTKKCYSFVNHALYNDSGKDEFEHEQNLMISGSTNVLVMGCGHSGVVNILEKAAEYRPDICIGGYHLFNPFTKKTVPVQLLDQIAENLQKYDIHYYTCHCTGKKAYHYLSERLPNMHYLTCGESIEV